MRYVKHLIVLSIVLMCLLALTPQRTFACSCAGRYSPQTEWAGASAVFAGKVIRLEAATMPLPLLPGSPIEFDAAKVTIQVTSIWKGLSSPEIAIYTAIYSASCGYSFQSGNEYLVYAYTVADKLTTSLCMRTSLLSKANEDLQVLGVGQPPTPIPQPVVVSPNELSPMNLVLPALAAIVIIGLILGRRIMIRKRNG